MAIRIRGGKRDSLDGRAEDQSGCQCTGADERYVCKGDGATNLLRGLEREETGADEVRE